MLLDHDEPTNYEEAMMSPDTAKWLKAIVGVKTGGSRVGGPEQEAGDTMFT